MAAAPSSSSTPCDAQPARDVEWRGANQVPMVFVTLTNTSTSRAVSMNSTFSELGLHVHPFVVQKHPQGSVVGIFRSHTEAVKHMYNLSQTDCSPLFVIFEDDIVPTRLYSAEVMEAIIGEMVATKDDFDMAYFGSIQWIQLLWWMPPWHRVTLHMLDHAWSTMHANVYTRRGLEKVLPIFEARLAEMEADSTSEPEHIDLFLEHDDRTRGVVRRQVVPYMLDQNWFIPSGNVDRCAAEDIKCADNEQDFEQTYLRAGNHISWSTTCFEVGGYPVRFYLIFIPAVLLAIFIPTYLCFRCYRNRRCCFARCPPPKADAAAPSEGSALLAKK